MRALILVAWLMIPVGLGIWHYGPGQEHLQLDEVGGILAQADHLAAAGEWTDAAAQYDEALRRLPADRVAESQRIRLERAKAWMNAKQLPSAHADLQTLVEELKSDAKADPRFVNDARAALANSQYYMTWLMRLEGQPREMWEPEIESARQTYRLLAEDSMAKGDADGIKKNREDLESSIRLARMDLSELQGLPLPSQ
jgi:hypothetical protein